MSYIYFVSYSFVRNGGMGFGNIEYLSPEPITTLDRTRRIEELIGKNRPGDAICVMWYQLLRTEE